MSKEFQPTRAVLLLLETSRVMMSEVGNLPMADFGWMLPEALCGCQATVLLVCLSCSAFRGLETLLFLWHSVELLMRPSLADVHPAFPAFMWGDDKINTIIIALNFSCITLEKLAVGQVTKNLHSENTVVMKRNDKTVLFVVGL